MWAFFRRKCNNIYREKPLWECSGKYSTVNPCPNSTFFDADYHAAWNRMCRNLLREESARKLLKDLKLLTEFDDKILGRILAKVEAVGKDKITVTFCGGYTITQEIE